MKNKTIKIDNIRKIASDKSRTLKQKKSSGELMNRMLQYVLFFIVKTAL